MNTLYFFKNRIYIIYFFPPLRLYLLQGPSHLCLRQLFCPSHLLHVFLMIILPLLVPSLYVDLPAQEIDLMVAFYAILLGRLASPVFKDFNVRKLSRRYLFPNFYSTQLLLSFIFIYFMSFIILILNNYLWPV